MKPYTYPCQPNPGEDHRRPAGTLVAPTRDHHRRQPGRGHHPDRGNEGLGRDRCPHPPFRLAQVGAGTRPPAGRRAERRQHGGMSNRNGQEDNHNEPGTTQETPVLIGVHPGPPGTPGPETPGPSSQANRPGTVPANLRRDLRGSPPHHGAGGRASKTMLGLRQPPRPHPGYIQTSMKTGEEYKYRCDCPNCPCNIPKKERAGRQCPECMTGNCMEWRTAKRKDEQKNEPERTQAVNGPSGASLPVVVPVVVPAVVSGENPGRRNDAREAMETG